MARGSALLALAAPHSTVHASLTSICASEDYDGCDDADGLERMRQGRSCWNRRAMRRWAAR